MPLELEPLEFNPPEGLMNRQTHPTHPISEDEIRGHMMKYPNALKAFVNDMVVAKLITLTDLKKKDALTGIPGIMDEDGNHINEHDGSSIIKVWTNYFNIITKNPDNNEPELTLGSDNLYCLLSNIDAWLTILVYHCELQGHIPI